MQVVIEIPNVPIQDYQDLYYKIYGMAASEGLFDDKRKSQRALALKAVLDVLSGVVNGTPLPKGHGRLIDADAITKDFNTFQNSFVINIDSLTGKSSARCAQCTAPTIIPADKGMKND